MLNIFFNRELEIVIPFHLDRRREMMRQRSNKEYKSWIAEAKHLFYDFVRRLELRRRRESKNLEQRTYHEALNNFKF